MRKFVMLALLIASAVILHAQSRQEKIDQLNTLFGKDFLKYDFPHKATAEGLYVMQLKAGTPEKDEKGPYSYFVQVIKWSDITSILPNVGQFGGRVLVIRGKAIEYIKANRNDAVELEYDGRKYKKMEDKASLSLFFTTQPEYELMDKISVLLNELKKG